MNVANKIILALWFVLIGVFHAPATVLDASGNHVGQMLNAAADGVNS